MLNNNHNNSSCAFAEQIVSYIYDEVDLSEKTEFELHLKECLKCADELAGLNFAHSSIVEWRKAEFSNLPNFVIPFEETTNEKIVLSNQVSWLNNLRQLFTFPLAKAAVGFAFLIICVGAFLTVFNFFGNNDEVAKNKTVNVAVSESQNSESKQVTENTQTVAEKQDSSSISTTPNEIETRASKTTNLHQIAPRNLVVKTENKSRAVPNYETIAKDVNKSALNNKNKANSEIVKNSAVKNSQVPKLTNFEDEEDKSLRLADLLAEFDDN